MVKRSKRSASTEQIQATPETPTKGLKTVDQLTSEIQQIQKEIGTLFTKLSKVLVENQEFSRVCMEEVNNAQEKIKVQNLQLQNLKQKKMNDAKALVRLQ